MQTIKIHHSPEYSQVLDEFSNFFSSQVTNKESLECTERLINLNPSFYPAWKYRRTIIYSIGNDQFLESDLHLTRRWCMRFPKNFQVWYHRQSVVKSCIEVGIIESLEEELKSIRECFQEDPKNYHAWNWLIWLVRNYANDDDTLLCLKEELDFSLSLIEQDPYNNSAWNYRYFLFVEMQLGKREIAKEELIFCQSWILKHSDNEAPWSYFGALAKHFEIDDFSGFSLPFSPFNPLFELEEKAQILLGEEECEKNKLWIFMSRCNQ